MTLASLIVALAANAKPFGDGRWRWGDRAQFPESFQNDEVDRAGTARAPGVSSSSEVKRQKPLEARRSFKSNGEEHRVQTGRPGDGLDRVLG